MVDIFYLAAAFISCVSMSYFFIKYIRKNNVFEKLLQESDNSTYERRIHEEERYKKEGNTSQRNTVYKLDLMLMHSGIKDKLPFINTEVFLLLLSCVTLLTTYIAGKLLQNSLLGLGFGTLVLFIIICILFVLVSRNEKIVDENILQFADLLESYSSISDDIVDILERSSEYLEEPLCHMVKECVTESKTDGNVRMALQRLRMRVGNRKLSELLLNIEECAQSNADYASVIGRCKNSISIYISEKEERAHIAKDAKINIVIMLGVMLVSMKVMESFIEDNIITFMMASYQGRIVLYGAFVVMLITLWKIITLGKK